MLKTNLSFLPLSTYSRVCFTKPALAVPLQHILLITKITEKPKLVSQHTQKV
jgi:hypothetical protein